MPAKSKSQQRFFGMVHAYKTGRLKKDDVGDESLWKKIKKVANSISDEDAKDFAETGHDGLPNRVEEMLNAKTKFETVLRKKIREQLGEANRINTLYHQVKNDERVTGNVTKTNRGVKVSNVNSGQNAQYIADRFGGKVVDGDNGVWSVVLSQSSITKNFVTESTGTVRKWEHYRNPDAGWSYLKDTSSMMMMGYNSMTKNDFVLENPKGVQVAIWADGFTSKTFYVYSDFPFDKNDDDVNINKEFQDPEKLVRFLNKNKFFKVAKDHNGAFKVPSYLQESTNAKRKLLKIIKQEINSFKEGRRSRGFGSPSDYDVVTRDDIFDSWRKKMKDKLDQKNVSQDAYWHWIEKIKNAASTSDTSKITKGIENIRESVLTEDLYGSFVGTKLVGTKAQVKAYIKQLIDKKRKEYEGEEDANESGDWNTLSKSIKFTTLNKDINNITQTDVKQYIRSNYGIGQTVAVKFDKQDDRPVWLVGGVAKSAKPEDGSGGRF